MSIMNKPELEQEYIKVKSEIQAHITMIKTYLDNIQTSKNQIDVLGKRLTELQQQYVSNIKDTNDEFETSRSGS